MDLYISILLGVLIYAGFQWNETYNLPKFNWTRMIFLPMGLSVLTGFAMVWAKDDLQTIYPMTRLSAVFIGVSGQAIFKKVGGIFDKKLNTVIGVNDNG